MQVCDMKGRCCTTALNDPAVNNQETGNVDTFSSDMLGDCSDGNFYGDLTATLSKDGSDGWFVEWAEIKLDDGRFHTCMFNSWLDNDPNYDYTNSVTVNCAEEQNIVVTGYHYQYFPWNQPNFRFKVQATTDVHVLFAPGDGEDGYEIVIGGWNNGQSVIRRGRQGTSLSSNIQTPGIVSPSEFRGFWITTEVKNGKLEIKVGKEGENVPFMSGNDNNPLQRNYVALASWTSNTATYQFATTTTTTPPPTLSTFTVEEGNETIVQLNNYQKSTGILVMKVPAHKDYSESEFMVQQESNTLMLKTGGLCQLADLPEYMNVSDMADNFENRQVDESATERKIKYVLKEREARYGSQKREELLPEARDLCKTMQLVKTNDFEVNETAYEKLARGEVAILENLRSSGGKRSKRGACSKFTACIEDGPQACGNRGWTDPTPPHRSISFHDISMTNFCINCYLQKFGDQCNEDAKLCLCKNMKNKNDLIACKVPGAVTTKIRLTEDIGRRKRETRVENTVEETQTMLYNKNEAGASIGISADTLEVVMHAHPDGHWHEGTAYGGIIRNNWLMKIQDEQVCYISTLKDDVYPVDIALGINEIKTGNDETTEDDEVDTHVLLLDKGPMDTTNLHRDITRHCKNLEYKKFVETPITKTQSEDLKNGKPIFLNSRSDSNCELTTATMSQHSGSWRYPNTDGAKLWIHQIVHVGINVTCCLNSHDQPTCCQDKFKYYCECKDVTQATFKQCGEDKTKKALFVATGQDLEGLLSSVEILTEDDSGMYRSRQVDIGGCSGVTPFPIKTADATGALFNDLPHMCPEYKDGEQSRECFKLKIDGSWEEGFNLQEALKHWGSSVVFDDWEGVNTAWWIVGGEPDGFQTEVWGGNPPKEISNEIKLPNTINQPCMAKISEHEAFITAVPKDVEAGSNFAWIFNIQSNTWNTLPATKEKRLGVSCGFLNTTSGRFVVLAGGENSSTTEIFNLDTRTWSLGPDIGVNLEGGSMVSVNDQQLLLVGGYNSITSQVMSEIRRMNESMASWETVGQLTTARALTVALAVPFGDLPPLC
eukprot:GFUD01013997.1.p1 GENE.GFUD01013997.1~~GFUD01013997.1.p1  ORF type:complete len:1217 (+),score=231.72 GFUD01013997.1:486-3653(+)